MDFAEIYEDKTIVFNRQIKINRNLKIMTVLHGEREVYHMLAENLFKMPVIQLTQSAESRSDIFMTRMKMSREDRAKQFMPFAALKGYPDALRKKEKIVVEKQELSDEYKEELDFKLRQVRKNDMITVVYYYKGEYLKVTGMVSRIDETARILKIVNTKIDFEDLCEIKLEN